MDSVDPASLSFEAALERLESIVESMESGNVPLADLLTRFARQMFPALRPGGKPDQALAAPETRSAEGRAASAAAPASRWMGHRPSTPDGLPVIGPSAQHPDIVHAFGHGHVGLAAAPATAELVADLLAGRTPAIDPGPDRADRF